MPLVSRKVCHVRFRTLFVIHEISFRRSILESLRRTIQQPTGSQSLDIWLSAHGNIRHTSMPTAGSCMSSCEASSSCRCIHGVGTEESYSSKHQPPVASLRFINLMLAGTILP